ncbi:MAG: polysaccharide deacetylase family protein [Clostridia bacterium]|nr:polysaccharide deacetylase family protein [Clostridia bacterium]
MHNFTVLLLLCQLFMGPLNQEMTAPQQPFVLREEIPILMYHEIGTPSGPWKELYVEPENFVRQLDWLKENGYSTVTLDDVYAHWYYKKPLPEKPVVLTFDDGYRNMYDIVLPLLLSRDMKATFFLYPSKFNTPTGLTTEMVAEMAAKGMEIGSHTYSHKDLTKISAAQLEQELAKSKKVLEEITGKPVKFLCYPSGQFNEQVIKESKKAGYLAAVTTQMGKAAHTQDPYRWKRVRINYSTTLASFSKRIAD